MAAWAVEPALLLLERQLPADLNVAEILALSPAALFGGCNA